uniref:ATP-binding cassette sub-family G member 4 n=1 Tax=Cacopsylla melanoneura TaxID=428564 RepID=A0A8D8Y8I1_9HEMI
MASESRAILTHLPKTTPFDIKFNDIKFSVKQGTKKKNILNGVSGCFQSGELTAIMGPSGAGKSSLLNILTGFQPSGYKGIVQATNIKECTSKKLSTRSSCYIMQDDNLSPLFTVLEIMMMAADLKLKASYKYKQLIVDDILDTIGLVLSKHTLCGRLSGGQKKRLSIALELIDNPPIMFLDEPTTGLDSVSTNQCVAMLKALARGGRTIVCTIHQPSATIFEMVDHLYVIAEGQCVYKGSSANTIPYLQTIGLQCPQYHNPADFLLEVVTGEYGHFTSTMMSAANDSWRSLRPPLTYNIDSDTTHTTERNEMGTTEKLQPPSEFIRFGVLLNRFIIQLYRDWTVTHLKMLLHFAVGILLGLLYTNMGVDGSKIINNIGFFMASLVYLSYTSLIPAILKCKYNCGVSTLGRNIMVGLGTKEIFEHIETLETVYRKSLKTYFVSGIPCRLFATE